MDRRRTDQSLQAHGYVSQHGKVIIRLRRGHSQRSSRYNDTPARKGPNRSVTVTKTNLLPSSKHGTGRLEFFYHMGLCNGVVFP
jgi:hypothetical protein